MAPRLPWAAKPTSPEGAHVKLLDYIDLLQNELRNARVQNLSSAPSTPVAGQIYWDTTLGQFGIYSGSGWVYVGGGGYTDEQAQDAIGAALTDTTTIDFTYNDAANTIIADVKKALDHTWVTDFDTQVRTSRLDQMAAPTADVSLNSHKLTHVTDPTGAQDAATKNYVDAAINGLDWKANVRAATTGAGTLASSFQNGSVIDGVTLASGDRILIKNQASGPENGLYTVNGSGAQTRATDADANAEVTTGLTVAVSEGTVNGDTIWMLTSPDASIVLGTSSLVFTELPAPNMLTVVAPLVRTGNQLSLDTTSTTHVARIWSGAPTGGATSEVVTHSLGTRDVIVQVINNASPWDAVMVTWEATSTNTVTIRSGANLPAGYRVVVTG